MIPEHSKQGALWRGDNLYRWILFNYPIDDDELGKICCELLFIKFYNGPGALFSNGPQIYRTKRRILVVQVIARDI